MDQTVPTNVNARTMVSATQLQANVHANQDGRVRCVLCLVAGAGMARIVGAVVHASMVPRVTQSMARVNALRGSKGTDVNCSACQEPMESTAISSVSARTTDVVLRSMAAADVKRASLESTVERVCVAHGSMEITAPVSVVAI